MDDDASVHDGKEDSSDEDYSDESNPSSPELRKLSTAANCPPHHSDYVQLDQSSPKDMHQEKQHKRFRSSSVENHSCCKNNNNTYKPSAMVTSNARVSPRHPKNIELAEHSPTEDKHPQKKQKHY